MSANGKKVKALKDLHEYIQPGKRSMIHCAINGYCWPISYRHHIIMLGHTLCPDCDSIQIIHYSASASECCNGKVMLEIYTKEAIEKDIENGLYILLHDDYPKNAEEYDLAYKRFEEREGEQKFSTLTNNCEHLANYILTNKSVSYQINNLTWFEKGLLKIFSFSLSCRCGLYCPPLSMVSSVSRRNLSSSVTCKTCGQLPSSLSLAKSFRF